MFLLLFLYALAASSFTLAKAALFYTEPIFFVGIRMVVAGALLLGYCLFTRSSWYIPSRDWGRFILIVLFHIYLAFVLDLVALDYMTSSKAAFIYNLAPFIAALFSYFYFDERMTLKKWLGLGIGFLGFLPEFIASAPQERLVGSIGVLSWPELMMIGSVVCSVVGWVVLRSLVQDGYSSFFVNGIGMLLGGILALITSRAFEVWNDYLVKDWKTFLYLLFLLILSANIVFYNLYGYLLKKYTATFLAFAGFLTPLFAALFGRIFLGELISWHFYGSVGVVVIGLSLFYSEELRQGYIKT